MSDVLDRLLDGAVDLHVHPFPSPFPRRIDTLEAAQHAGEHGLRAIVIKSHHHSTATDVAALRPHGIDETGVETFGAIALNSQVGYLNPAAVNLCLALGGKVVFFPTISSPAHLAHEGPKLKFPKLAIPLQPEQPNDIWEDEDRGTLRQEVHDILALVADADAVLSAGHLPPKSILALFEAAQEAGVRRMLVNHPEFVIGASRDEVAKMLELGAYVEHSLCMYEEDSTFHQDWGEIDHLVDWIRFVGPERSLLGSDLGQQDNPLPGDTFRKICRRLLDSGLTEREVRQVVADNGRGLLGIDA